MIENLKNPEIELAALGAVLIDPGALADVAAFLKPDDFADHRNRAIFQAALDLQDRGAIPDMLTMAEALKGNKFDIDAGYLTKLLDCPTSLNALEYARQVGDLSTRRRLLREANELAQRVCDLKKPVTNELPPTRDPWENSWQTLADAFKERKAAEYVVENLIRIPSLIAWYGNPGDLKTFLLQYIFLCIAAGKPCFPEAPWKSGGRVFSVNPCPVLWLDFDNGIDLTKERFEALARAMDIDPALENLHFVSMPTPWLVLGDPKSAGFLINQIQKFGAHAIGIDNLGTTKGAAKENTDEMIPVMSTLRQIVETTRSGISIIHHETKGGALAARRGDSLRGHSSIEAAVDLALLVEREPGSDIVTVHSTKTRGTIVEPFAAAFTYSHKPGTEDLETAMFYGLPCENKKSPKAIEDAIREELADEPMLKTKLAKEVHTKTEGIGLNRIRDYIERMINEEKIITTPGGKTTGELCALR